MAVLLHPGDKKKRNHRLRDILIKQISGFFSAFVSPSLFIRYFRFTCSQLLEDFLNEGRMADEEVPDIVFEQLSFNHPLVVNFTSGTTGLPKAAIHSVGVSQNHATFIYAMSDKISFL